jgi:hypothetical protein
MLGEKQLVWIEALKSGNYEQGKECLCSVNDDSKNYCCLGVGCEILGYESQIVERGGRFVLSFHDEYEISEKFATEIGLWTADGRPVFADFQQADNFKVQVQQLGIKDYSQLSLAAFNDGDMSFANIAKLLEEFPRIFFKSIK